MAGKYSGKPPPSQIPKDANEGAAAVRNAVLKLFRRLDGQAADWALMSESLLKVAYECLDRVQDDGKRLSLLRRMDAGTYDRLAKNDAMAWQDTPAPGSEPMPQRGLGPRDLTMGGKPSPGRGHG